MNYSYTEIIEYMTQDGDRWDLIAYKFYGDSRFYEPIIKANPIIPIGIFRIPAGIMLKIPKIKASDYIQEEIESPWAD